MPFTDHRCLVAGALKQFWKGRLRTVQALVVAAETVQMAVLARQHDGSARAANRIRTEAIAKAHSFCGDAIEIWRLVNPRAVATHRVGRMIVGKNEQNV